MADPGVIAGFTVLGVVLVAVIILIIVLILLVIKKIKYQHEELTELRRKLETIEEGTVNKGFEEDRVTERQKKHEVRPDSAVDMCDSSSVSTSGRNSTYLHNGNVGYEVPSSFRTVKPRYTMKIRKQKANVYGQGAHVSQVIQMAQNFSNSLHADRSIVPVDQIHVEEFADQDAVVNTLSEVCEGRPTSILMDTMATTEKVIHEQGMFVHKSVGADGGTLTISGITLEIPPGALKESKMITLGEIWNKEYLPKLPKNKSRLSPVILCQPCIKFAKPVHLIFPHCAHNVMSDWTPKIMKRQGDIKDNVDWTDVTLTDYDERNVSASKVSVHLKHFTLYTLVGESKQGKIAAKKVKLVAFTEPFSRGALFKTRIYCINDYDAEVQEVNKDEKRLGGKQNNAAVPLLFHDNGEHLIVQQTTLADNWNILGSKTEEMDFELVWHAMSPYSNFVFQSTGKKIRMVYCEFQSYQKENNQHSVTVKISDEVRETIILPQVDEPLEKVRQNLIVLLDPKSDNPDVGDFRSLGQKMDLDASEIKFLESKVNPTEILLDRWESTNNDWTQLHKMMLEMNRHDAALEIRTYLETV